jgi:ribonuclease BN (tRNA processing enzyme)
MKLLFLGVSAAFCVGEDSFQSNMLLTSKSGRKLLIDCGSDIRHSLYAQGFSHSDIDAVYISHLHSDHTGGLEWLGFSKYFIEEEKPKLFITGDLIDKLWENVLSGGMCSIEQEESTLSTYFNPILITNNQFVWEDYSIALIKTDHYFSNSEIMPSYGLVIKSKSQQVLLTTDTRFTPDLFKTLYKTSDLIFHDCETSAKPTGQHARYEELQTLPPEIRKKMWLYDYNKGTLPNAKKDGFKGFVLPGQIFDL